MEFRSLGICLEAKIPLMKVLIELPRMCQNLWEHSSYHMLGFEMTSLRINL